MILYVGGGAVSPFQQKRTTMYRRTEERDEGNISFRTVARAEFWRAADLVRRRRAGAKPSPSSDDGAELRERGTQTVICQSQ